MKRGRRWALLALGLFFLSTLSCAADTGAQAPEEPKSGGPVLAVRAPEPLAAALRDGGFFRWGLPRLEGLRVEMGPEATGDAVLVVSALPATGEAAALAKGLPVDLSGEAVVLDGRRYAAPGHVLALRVPGAERTTWLVAGRDPEKTVRLADEVLFRLGAALTGQGRGRRSQPLEVDYLLRETPWLERSGRWVKGEDGAFAVDRAKERDDFAEREQALATLAEIRGERVVLRVPAGEKQRPEMARLAADLDRAAGEMAPRVPVALAEPVVVILETDFVAQGRHTGEVGEAVVDEHGDLHIVYHPEDLFAWRYGLARGLLGRAGLAEKVPGEIVRGAALWLSRDWYGKPYPEWLPVFAAARVLPEAGQLLAEREPADASGLLWTPAAAAVVDRLPGATVAEKLARAPEAGRVAEILAQIESSAGPPLRTSGGAGTSFLAGISLAMLNSLEAGYHAPGLARQLDVLAGLGGNAVSLMPFASQPGPSVPELRFLNDSPGSETDAGLIHATRLSRARGFHVLYKPHLWVSGASWPGEVEMKREEDWARWWRGYRRYILHHAFLARWAGADLFSVGVELSKTTGREAEWRDLIAATRLLFPGKVTYAANWHGDLEQVRFWDALDFVGVDAYFPLAPSPQAGRADLERGARQIADRLAAASRRAGKPVLLTEVGFAARRGAWVAPHEEGGEYSEEDQALAYEALFSALGRPRWLGGAFVWKAFSGGGSDSGHSADFRFLGRKAEGAVRGYYGAEARR